MNKSLSNPKKNIFEVVSFLRFPLAVFVVLGHANPYRFDMGMEVIRKMDYNVMHFFIQFVGWSLFLPAVPLFFFISGFLFFVKGDFNLEVYKKKIVKRIHSLLIPYLVWNAIFLILNSRWLFKDINLIGYVTTFILAFIGLPFEHIINMEMSCPIDPPLWFIRDLLGVMFFSPLIYILVARFERVYYLGLFSMLICYLSGSRYQYWIPGISLPALLFFSIGAYCGIKKNEFLVYLYKYRNILVISWAILLYYNVMASINELYFKATLDGVCAIMGGMSYLIIGTVLANSHIYKPIISSGGVFVIYALHMPILPYIYKFYLDIFPYYDISEFLISFIYLLSVFSIVMISFVLEKLLSMNVTSAYLFTGGRA